MLIFVFKDNDEKMRNLNLLLRSGTKALTTPTTENYGFRRDQNIHIYIKFQLLSFVMQLLSQPAKNGQKNWSSAVF